MSLMKLIKVPKLYTAIRQLSAQLFESITVKRLEDFYTTAMVFERQIAKYKKWKDEKTIITLCYCIIISLVELPYGASTSYVQFAVEDINSNPSPFHISKEEQSWLTTIGRFGEIFGLLLAGPIAEYFGRKHTLLLSMLPQAFGWLLITCATNVYMMYGGKLLGGVAQGLTTAFIIILMVEFAPKDIRGGVAIIPYTEMTFGKVLVSSFFLFLTWSWISVLSIGLTLIATIGLCFMPESPRWLLAKSIQKQKPQLKGKASNVLRLIRNEETAKKELEEMEEDLLNVSKPAPWIHIFKTKNLLLTAGICFMRLLDAFGGTSFIDYYSINIFEAVGSTWSSDIQTIFMNCMSLLFALLCPFLMDLKGRRYVTFAAYTANALLMAAVASYFYVDQKVDAAWAEQYISWLPLLCFILFQLFHTLGIMALSLLAGELFPTDMRGRVNIVAEIWSQLSSFFSGKSFPDLSDAIGICNVFWMSAAFNLIVALIYILTMPEANKKSLERIQLELQVHNENNNVET